jgi:hypothetical protein
MVINRRIRHRLKPICSLVVRVRLVLLGSILKRCEREIWGRGCKGRRGGRDIGRIMDDCCLGLTLISTTYANANTNKHYNGNDRNEWDVTDVTRYQEELAFVKRWRISKEFLIDCMMPAWCIPFFFSSIFSFWEVFEVEQEPEQMNGRLSTWHFYKV